MSGKGYGRGGGRLGPVKVDKPCKIALDKDDFPKIVPMKLETSYDELSHDNEIEGKTSKRRKTANVMIDHEMEDANEGEVQDEEQFCCIHH